MRLVSVTVESHITKNLGSYQSAKAQLALTIEVNQEITTESFDLFFGAFLNTLNAEMEGQLRQQIIHAQRAITKDDDGQESDKEF